MQVPENTPKEIRDSLTEIIVPYLSFSGTVEEGALIVHKELADELLIIFHKLLTLSFPIEKIVPMKEYGWDDEASMEDNNTSAFNYRVIFGTERLSHHARGRALDLNPKLNPHYARDGSVFPKSGTYEVGTKGTITKGDEVVKLYTSYGWTWGGDWETIKDYQHFEKP